MPIARINPDGTVKIYNNNTGEVKDVRPEELPQYNPRLVGDYQKLLATQPEQTPLSQPAATPSAPLATAQAEPAQPKTGFGALLNTQPATQLTDQGNNEQSLYQQAWKMARTLDEQNKVADTWKKAKGYDLFSSSKPTAEEVGIKKQEVASGAAMGLIKSLEAKFRESKGGTFGIGPGARIKGVIESGKGAVGLNESAKVYNDSKAGFAATLKTLTGDVGVLTDQDYARLAGLIPDLGATKKEATDKFNQLRDQVSAKFGVKTTETEYKPIVENERGAIASLADVLFPGAVDYAEKGIQGQLAVQKKPMSLTDILASGAGPLGVAASRPDIFKETIGPAFEVSSGLVAGGAIKNKVSGSWNLLNPKPALSQARNVAAQTIEKPVSLKPILEAGDKYVSRDPTATRLWNDILKPALEKQKDISISDLLKQNQVWNDAYTSAGKVGKTALAGLSDALARAGKEVIKQEAPEVAKLTAKLAGRYNIEKLLGRFGPAAVGAAGAVTGATILGKALGQQRR